MIDKEIVFQHINELENIIKQLEHYKNISFTDELLAKMLFLQEAPEMEIAKLILYKKLVFY
ncbi:MAG: hypothetical protein JW822_05755 [Spirochaetales bacterium]|nr:hypothetical protein [Spirochaetales bacterium]